MNPPIRKIVIVGGGASGWMAACFLQRMLSRQRPDITVVEGEDGPIGVGEATIPTLRDMLRVLGIDERKFMIETDATFKLAIRFENWLYDPAFRPGYYYHPFDKPQPMNGFEGWNIILASQKNLSPERYADLLSVQPALCENLRAPKIADSPNYGAPTGYAYHFDAIKFGKFLRNVAMSRGVQRVTDQVVEVNQNEQEYITSVKTSNNGEFEGDLFIDCTGFKSLLIGKTYKVPFTPWNKHLFCDRAVALQVPYPPLSSIKPYTTSTAARHGWIWEIGLSSRKGIGYVYSSQFVSDEEAEQELREHIGPAADNLAARRIQMRIGRHNKFWVKNCVSIGLSAGFLEPLESTGIYLTEMGLKHLMENFPVNGFDESLSSYYNDQMAKLYDETLNFIVLHYCLTQREDTPFWRANKYHQNIPEDLQQDLKLWQHRLPSPWDKSRPGQFYGAENYLFILAGMSSGKLPGSPHDGLLDYSMAQNYINWINDMKKQALTISPDHGEYIRAMRD